MCSCQDEEGFEENSVSNNTSISDLVRTCATHDKMDEWLKDPSFRAKHEAKFTRLSTASALSRSTCDDPPIIPVAVHFQGVSGADATCLVSLAQTQIDILNKDFGGTNSDISQWTNGASSSFPGLSNGEACLKFCLADQNHPNGYNLVEGKPAVTINQTSGDSNSDFSGYLNIFVQFGTGVLGYAPLGGSGNGDGVVIEGTAFGTGSGCGNIVPEAPYNLGRTTTHEVGHYLLLDHIWGGGCGQDDDVADTPESNEPYYDCPAVGASSCNSTDLHMNYMDYTNDACMYMFSAGQISRSENYVATSLVILTGNASAKCSGASGDNGDDDTDEDDDGEDDEDEDGDDDDNDEDEDDDDTDDEGEDDGPIDSDCEAPATDYYTGQALTSNSCYESVISVDQYCCQVEFDWICMDLYEECLLEQENEGDDEGNDNNCVEAIDVFTGEILSDACVSEVQVYDSYCCDIEWDVICQEFYDYCVDYGFGNVSNENKKNAMISIGENQNKGQVIVSYSIRDWKPNTIVEIYDGFEMIKKITATKRRGTFRLDLGAVSNRSLNADIKIANKVLARTVEK